MAYVVGIEIKATTETGAIETAEQAVKQLGQTAQQANRKLAQETGRAAQQAHDAYERHAQGAIKARTALLPLSAAVAQATQAMRAQSPAAAAAANAVDNLTFSVAASAIQTGTWRGAMGLLMGLFNPWTLAVLAAGAALAFFTARAEAAKRATEEINRVQQKYIDTFIALRRATELLNAGTERQQLEIRLEHERRDIINSELTDTQKRIVLEELAAKGSAVRAALGRQEAKEYQEQQRRLAEAVAGTLSALDDQIQAVRAQIKELNEGTDAAIDYATANLLGSDAVRKAGEAAEFRVKQLGEERKRLAQTTADWAERKRVLDAAAAAEENVEETVQRTTEALAAHSRSLETDLGWQQRIADLDVDFLRILGRSDDAERRRIANVIETTRARLELIKTGDILSEQSQREIEFLEKTIAAQEEALQRVGAVTLDIGRALVDTLADMAQGMATGTLKGFDIVKAAGSAALRFFTDMLRQTLAQKFSFEINLLGNLKGLPGQMQGALAGGGMATGGGSGGGGGIFGILQDLLGTNLIGSSTVGGTIGAGLGGFALGGSLGGNLQQNIFSSIGSIGGSLLGGTALGGSILTGVFDALTLGGTSLLGFGGAGLAGIVGELLGNFLLPGIGSLLGLIFSGLFSQPINPTVSVRSKLEGILYDELQNKFLPGDVISKGTGKDIPGSVVKSVTNDVQRMLKGWSEQWADLLNIFPVFAHDKMIPALDDANKLLNHFFGRLKFSEGGSRTIAEEMKALQERFGPSGFFLSLREVIGIGLNETLTRAGFDFSDLIAKQFAPIVPGAGGKWQDALKQGGLQPPTKGEDVEKFVTALTNFFAIASGLANISPRGVGQFLGTSDNALLDEQIRKVLSITDGNQFTAAVDKLQRDLKPILDFLEASVRQAAEAFAQAMGAAFQAASADDAKTAFIDSLKQSTAQAVQAGFVQAFLATTEFNDLLAPLQKAIKEAMDAATLDGEFDPASFGFILGPIIDEIIKKFEELGPIAESTWEVLRPLLDALGMTGGANQFSGIEQNIEALNLQLRLVGQTATEQLRIQREAALSAFGEQSGLPPEILAILQSGGGLDDVMAGLSSGFGNTRQPIPITAAILEAIEKYLELRGLLEEQDQLTIQLQAAQIFSQTTQGLEQQLALIGKTGPELEALQQQFYLAALAAQGLSDSQIAAIASLLDQISAATAAANAQAEAERQAEEAARAAQQRAQEAARAAEQRNKLAKDTEASLKQQIALLGLSGEQAAALQRQFALDDLGLQGLLAGQIDRIQDLLETRDRTSFALNLVQGINELSPEAAFPDFLRRLSGSVEESLAAGITNAFVAQQVLPLIAGDAFQNILGNLGMIGRGLTAEEALALSQGDLTVLRGDLEAMRPVFEAMTELIRDLRGQIREGIGVPSVGSIVINIQDVGDRDARDLADEIFGEISGRLRPAV